MQKVKILAVAPYEGMADAISTLAQSRDDIQMTVQIGDLDSGRKIAIELAHNNYDVILSRGGTAELIRSTVELPVIDIPISVYDVLRTIKLAENFSGKFVIAGFSAITSCSRVLCDLLQYDIDIITFTNEADAIPALRKAQKNGCMLVLSDMAGANAAQKLGMNSLLISSGTESITSAIDEAVKLVHSSQHVHKQKDLFQALLSDEDREFLIFNPAGTLWFSSLNESEGNIALLNLVQTYLKAFLRVPNQTISRQIRNKLYILTNRHLIYEEQKYTAIIIQNQEALFAEEDSAITVYNYLDQNSDYSSEYSNSHQLGNTSHFIEEYSKSNLPILILGESGTGKDKVARLLYENGGYHSSPLYTINCELMGERKWNTLLKNAASPLADAGVTIYLKNLAVLSKKQLDDLFFYLENSRVARRNHLIFSLTSNQNDENNFMLCKTYLENKGSCLTLKLPPLRERLTEFSSIAALYIHKMNVTTGKQIIGFEAEAMELMLNFSWPGNLDQLHHVVKELVTITKSPYISCKDVKLVLEQEKQQKKSITNSELDLSGTLDEINAQLIQLVLAEENGNKERTAKRLGISRSTLWRILKR